MQCRTTLRSSSRPPYVIYAVVLIALLGYRTAAGAAHEDPVPSLFSFSAFGTLGVVHSSEDQADFTASPLQPNGAGYTHLWSPAIDSRLGAQAIAQFTPQLSAMLQVISEQDYDKTYKPHVEWANITYQPAPDLSFRLGRIVLPTFLRSDSRKIGYANPWVRPPAEFYGLSPVFNSDGVDANYKLRLGNVISTLVGIYGNTRFRAPGGGEFQVRHLWVIADTIEYGPLTLHVAYQSSSYNYNTFDSIFDAFREFGPQGVALGDKYDLDNKRAQVMTAGALYDPGKWFLTGEWGRRDLHSAFGKSTAWYLSAGYRLAKFTPYLTYADVKPNSSSSDPGLTLSTLPPYLVGPAMALNGALNAILGSGAAAQNTISVGSRLDFARNIDLKVQYDHIDIGRGSQGTLINVQPDFQRGGSLNLFSIAVDFVW